MSGFVSPSTGAEIRAILFDTFGSVVDWRSRVARAVAGFAAAQQLTLDPPGFADAWRAKYEPSMEPVRSGRREFVWHNYIIAPLSNGNLSLLTSMAKYAGLPWDVILASDVTRAYKPSPDAYRRAADFLNLTPGEVMLAAAHNRDLAAARQAGFATGFVLRPAGFGAAQSTDLAPEQRWDVTAEGIVDPADQVRHPKSS